MNGWMGGSLVQGFQLTLSLPNVTVVKFTVHCQTRLQSKFKVTVDSVIRDTNLFISKCSGYIIILNMEVYAIFCTRKEFTKKFAMSLDFAEIKNIKNMSIRMTYRTH